MVSSEVNRNVIQCSGLIQIKFIQLGDLTAHAATIYDNVIMSYR